MSKSFGLILATLLPSAVYAGGNEHKVTVGANGKLLFDPEYVQADEGDLIVFQFNPKAHSVTQSNFETPCDPLQYGFDTGLIPVAPDAGYLPEMSLYVNHTKPMWFYCKQQNPMPHCQQGMVFAVNPPPEGDDRSFSAFKALALKSGDKDADYDKDGGDKDADYDKDGGDKGSDYDNQGGDKDSDYDNQGGDKDSEHYGRDEGGDDYDSHEGGDGYDDGSYDSYAPQDHKIIVGVDGQLAFGPANISANPGDTVTFEFRPKAHGVTQSSFDDPCTPLAKSSDGHEYGFESGIMPVDANDTYFPTFTITINDTKPIWGYCPQTMPSPHCGQGMVFSINADEYGPNNFAAFLEKAKQTAAEPTGHA
ncbi:hypothetical protein V5O48_014037 [Marasmius crinis-equi]|uniref:Cupredoxin n=1 Tax=Marasmius crinis-equi TaxID=585013 RepID=A0ABR3EYE3_9AGAR